MARHIAVVGVIADGVVTDGDRVGQQAALGTKLDEAGAFRRRVQNRSTIQVLHGFTVGVLHILDFRRRLRISDAEREAHEAVVAGVEDAQAVRLGLDGHVGIGRPVDGHDIHEGFGNHRGRGRKVSVAGYAEGTHVRTVIPTAKGIVQRGMGGVVLGGHVDVREPEIAGFGILDHIGPGRVGGPGSGAHGHHRVTVS